jgi:hypothetical protein
MSGESAVVPANQEERKRSGSSPPSGREGERYPKRERKVPKRFHDEEFAPDQELGEDDYDDVEPMDLEKEITENAYDDEDGNEYDMEWCAEDDEEYEEADDDEEEEEEDEESCDDETEEEEEDIPYADDEDDEDVDEDEEGETVSEGGPIPSPPAVEENEKMVLDL